MTRRRCHDNADSVTKPGLQISSEYVETRLAPAHAQTANLTAVAFDTTKAWPAVPQG